MTSLIILPDIVISDEVSLATHFSLFLRLQNKFIHNTELLYGPRCKQFNYILLQPDLGGEGGGQGGALLHNNLSMMILNDLLYIWLSMKKAPL